MRICTKFVLLLYSKMKCSQSYSLNKISAWRQFMYRAIRTVSDPLFIIEVAHNKIWHCTLSSFFTGLCCKLPESSNARMK